MVEGIVIGGIVVAMYLTIYKYEEIGKNDDVKNKHYNHISKMWVVFPKYKSQ